MVLITTYVVGTLKASNEHWGAETVEMTRAAGDRCAEKGTVVNSFTSGFSHRNTSSSFNKNSFKATRSGRHGVPSIVSVQNTIGVVNSFSTRSASVSKLSSSSTQGLKYHSTCMFNARFQKKALPKVTLTTSSEARVISQQSVSGCTEFLNNNKTFVTRSALSKVSVSKIAAKVKAFTSSTSTVAHTSAVYNGSGSVGFEDRSSALGSSVLKDLAVKIPRVLLEAHADVTNKSYNALFSKMVKMGVKFR